MKYRNILAKINYWRIRHVKNRTFIILTASIIGLLAGLSAIILKALAHGIQLLLRLVLQNPDFNFLLFVFPLIGIMLTVFYIQRFRKGKLGRGVSSILVDIRKNAGIIDRDKTYSHLISSALTVGFGGSAGLEAPIVVTGAAIGSNTAIDLRMTPAERTLMLACGVAAGISAIFNSPIAGVLFAIEVILPEFSIASFIPILISSATASVLSNVLYKGQLFFLITKGWNLNAIPFYLMLGVLMGLLSVYVTRTSSVMERFFKSKGNPFSRALRGGIIIGIMIFIFPPLYGEGYYTIERLLAADTLTLLSNSIFMGFSDSPWFVLLVGLVIVLVKIIATSVTIGSGGNGGIFAPSLFMGALCGFLFAHAINLSGIVHLTEPNFIVAAMAGALSGVVHAPLTAIFLIAEITGGYALFVPLMIVSSISFVIARYFEPYSLYSRVMKDWDSVNQKEDTALLSKIELLSVLETDFISVTETESLGELISKIEQSRRNVFPVVDTENKLKGIVTLDEIREVMFDQNLYDTLHVSDFMNVSPLQLDSTSDTYMAMKTFELNGLWNLPVTSEGRYLGFVSKSTILSRYRLLLIKNTEAQQKVNL